VEKAVAQLPWAQRIVIVLYYINDCSLQEIAEILKIPAGTVKSRLHYARLALKEQMGASENNVRGLNFEFT
jgi:RNA polymerase sigma-70 factor (ECF subfamily)